LSILLFFAIFAVYFVLLFCFAIFWSFCCRMKSSVCFLEIVVLRIGDVFLLLMINYVLVVLGVALGVVLGIGVVLDFGRLGCCLKKAYSFLPALLFILK
jgi:hypothetical protein